MKNTTRHIDAADVAKMVRANLKQRFPGVKFRVRTSKYAGGASIDVRWLDGPTRREVQEILDRYAGATFDGMRDLKETHTSIITGTDGQPEEVHFGADFLFAERKFSPAFLRQVAEAVASEWGYRVPEIRVSDFDGSGYVVRETAEPIQNDPHRTIADVIMARAHDTAAGSD